MSRPALDRNSPWLPGATLLASAAGLAVGVGLLLGSTTWITYIGLSLGFLLLFGWVERFRIHRPPVPTRRRTHLKVIQGGRQYGLADDDTTDGQKYVM